MTWDGGFEGMFPVSGRSDNRRSRFGAKAHRAETRAALEKRRISPISSLPQVQERIVRAEIGDLDALY